MFTTFDDVRDFALTFVDRLVSDNIISSDIDTDEDNEFTIQDTLIQHFLDKIKQEDCIIPEEGEAYEITDYDEDYMVAFISSGGIPLGIFVIYLDTFEEDGIDIERLFVSINHNVVYLDAQQYDIT